MRRFWQFCADQRGATAIEYALIATLVAVAMVTAFTLVSEATRKMYTDIAATLAAPPAPGVNGP